MRLFAISLRLTVATLVCVAGTLAARTAEIGRGLSSAEVVIEGKIESGDCSKLGNFISSEGARRVYLASPGGSLFEAIEIGRLIRALKMETMVPGRLPDDLRAKRAAQHRLMDHGANFTCASACFFVFAAGVYRSRDFGDPILGIHRPYLSDRELQRLSSDQAVAAARGIRAVVDRYLNEMSVPASYAERMFRVPTDQVQWIGNDDFETDLEGIIPELRDWVAVRGRAILDELRKKEMAGVSAEDKAFVDEQAKRMLDPANRNLEVLSRLAGDAWKSMFAGSKSGETRRSFCNRSN